MISPNWYDELPVGIIVCDAEGIIVWMNDRAALIFRQSGGRDLIGKNMMACHPEDAQRQIRELLKTQKSHAYTVEIQGVKWLLFQSPWYEDGRFAGYVEFLLTLPDPLKTLTHIRWVR
jgi:PAS domain S-box-containing protein